MPLIKNRGVPFSLWQDSLTNKRPLPRKSGGPAILIREENAAFPSLPERQNPLCELTIRTRDFAYLILNLRFAHFDTGCSSPNVTAMAASTATLIDSSM